LFYVLIVLGNGELGGDASMVDFEERLLIKNIRKHVLGKLSTFLLL
jgi:hypothetical protein